MGGRMLQRDMLWACHLIPVPPSQGRPCRRPAVDDASDGGADHQRTREVACSKHGLVPNLARAALLLLSRRNDADDNHLRRRMAR